MAKGQESKKYLVALSSNKKNHSIVILNEMKNPLR